MLENFIAPLLNSYLAQYVDNLDTSQLKLSLWSGDTVLRNLKLKREALDKFRLPINVVEGSIGTLSLNIPWNNLKGKAVKVVIDDIYLLATPADSTVYDPEEDERRKQQVKMEKLTNAELLTAQPSAGMSEADEAKNQSFTTSLVSRVIDNLQITVRNIHIRYEDKLSVPGHPFAAGFTLSGFTAHSTDEFWNPTYLVNNAKGVHKLATLSSMAIYFDTDAPSIAGLQPEESAKKFKELIATKENEPAHQFVLKPVSGEGRLVLNHKPSNDTPKTDAELLFKELGFVVDEDQYRDLLSMVDLFHFYTRQYQYRKFQPAEIEQKENKAKSLWKFATKAILNEVHEKNRKWTWAYFAERRDDRMEYVTLFKLHSEDPTGPEIKKKLDDLEMKLAYTDIRFYRSIARSEMRKERASVKKTEEQKRLNPSAQQQPNRGWIGWIWGGAKTEQHEQPQDVLSEEQRQELYDTIDWDEKNTVASSVDLPREAIALRVRAKLDSGSFALRRDPHGNNEDVISLGFDGFSANVLKRTDNMEAEVALTNMSVYDGTQPSTKHAQVVRVKSVGGTSTEQSDEPFFYTKFENNPLDERADTGLTARLRAIEIFYHRGYLEEVMRFLKPPASQLESVSALIDAASVTLEGFSKETRAGLEFALQNHKTVDLRLDMKAPIIIIPQDVTQDQGLTMVVDAGHISVKSEMADKQALQSMRSKQSTQYTTEDWKSLEGLMYDKFHVDLDSTQIVLGEDLDQCMKALDDPGTNPCHLVDRINMSWLAETSIMPKTPNLARVKVSGHLPALSINFSDRKYRNLMKIVDIAVPHFDDPAASTATLSAPVPEAEAAPVMRRKSTTPFNTTEADEDITVDDDTETLVGEDEAKEKDEEEDEDVFFEAPDLKDDQDAVAKQITFELKFSVASLRVSISKAEADTTKPERLLANAVLESFNFEFALRKFDMAVDILLKSLYLEDKMVEASSEFRHLITSETMGDETAKEGKNLIHIKYNRCQADSPEFMSVFEGFNQSVDVQMSTLNAIITRGSILQLFDFVLSTFTNGNNGPAPSSDRAIENENPQTNSGNAEKLRVTVKLTSIVFILNNDGERLATLELSAATVGVLLRGPIMRVNARLGNLSLLDDLRSHTDNKTFGHLLAIRGDEVADLLYETYDPTDEQLYPGHDTLFHLRTGSLQLTFLEEPVRRLLRFLTQFARMKAVLDSARNAAAQQASELSDKVTKMHFDVLVKTPIIVLPRSNDSADVITANLGEISAKNTFKDSLTEIEAGLSSIQLISTMTSEGQSNSIKMLEDVDVTVNVASAEGIDRSKENPQPDTMVKATMSDVKVNLTEQQYAFLFALSRSVPKAFSPTDAEKADDAALNKALPSPPSEEEEIVAETPVDLLPELPRTIQGEDGQIVALYSKTEISFQLGLVNLELFSGQAVSVDSLKAATIAKFSLDQIDLKAKMLNNASMEAELLLKSFRVTDTSPARQTKWREIVPASKNGQSHQLMVSYSASGGADNSAVVNVSLDTPTIIFSLEPVFAVVDFLTSASQQTEVDATSQHPAASTSKPSENTSKGAADQSDVPVQSSSLAFRVNIVAAKIMLLADPTRSDCEAVVLSIGQLQMAQQSILVLTVSQLGMYLCSMDRQNETIQFLDNLDIALSLDDRPEHDMPRTSIELSLQEIVLRASYRDILLVNSIIQRASELSNKSSSNQAKEQPAILDASAQTQSSSVKKPITTSKRSQESLQATIDGFQLILIGDLHELPLLDIKASRFLAKASDWSSNMNASVMIAPFINFFNLSTSHWEPLLDPWEFTIQASKQIEPANLSLSVTSKKRLEVNLTSAFINLALTSRAIWDREGEALLRKTRGHSTPFLIRNRTGHSVLLWAESGDPQAKGEPTKIENLADVPWRFEDWRTMRENVLATSHNVLTMMLDGTSWERLKHVSVDREGEHIHALRPRLDKVTHRLLCEVRLEDNVKIVTLRSTFNVENLTLVPAELIVVDAKGQKASPVYKIAPGKSCPVPIEAAYHLQIRVRPDAGFKYGWSSAAFNWQDLIRKPARTITCKSSEREGNFLFQAFAAHDRADPMIRTYPRLTLRLRPPVEIENLLPFDVKFRIYDKASEHNYSSFLRKGGISPVHAVDLTHLILLSVELQGTTFDRSEFAIINTDNPDDLPIEDVLPIQDKEGMALQLRINYLRHPESGGAIKVQVYSPFVFQNKTGRSFALKSKGSTSRQADLRNRTQEELQDMGKMYLFSHASDDRRNRVLMRLENSEWSKPLSFEAVGTVTQADFASPALRKETRIGLKVSEGIGAYKLTKVVTAYPRFLIKNLHQDQLRIRQPGSDRIVKIAGQERVPFIDFDIGSGSEIVVAVGANQQWSAAINIQELGRTYLRYPMANGKEKLLQVEVLVDGACVHVQIQEETGKWPFYLRNHSSVPLSFYQTPTEDNRSKPRSYELLPGASLPYSFDRPSDSSKTLTLVSGSHRQEINPLEIGPQKPFAVPHNDGRKILALDVFAEEASQVVVLGDYKEENNLYKPQRNSGRQQPSRQQSTSSLKDLDFEVAMPDAPVTFSFKVEFEGIGISLVNSRMHELTYISFRGLDLSYSDTPISQDYILGIKWIQLDNQLFGGIFPIILYPSVIPKDGQELEAHPNVHASATIMKDKAHGVTYIKYATILLQQMTIEIDEDFIFSVIDFARFDGASWQNDKPSCLTEESAEIGEPKPATAANDIYFEILHLQPIQLDLSFMRTETLNSDSKTFLDNRNPVAFFLNALTMALGNVNDAPIRLNMLLLENQFTSQLYRVLGSADFLGNPIGLFQNVSSGVADAFYAPYEGLVGGDVGATMAKAYGNLVKKTVFGISDSMSKVTGSIGKGLSAATLDKEFQSRRRMRRSRNKPKHALYGVTSGAEGFVTSVASGFEGLARKPLEGAEADGPAGFFKGVGKGLVGAFTKPAVGIFDMASSVTEGIRNTTTVFDPSAIDRVRLPRHIASDGILRPYQEREALGQFWLKNLENGRYFKEDYVAHLDIQTDEENHDLVVILTQTRILLVRVLKLKVAWDVPLSDLQSISLEPKGIALILRKGVPGPFLAIPTQASRLWLFSSLERVVNNHNKNF